MLRRILHIDDDPADYLLLRKAFNGGHEVTQAQSLTEGLHHLSGGGYAAVVLDLALPDASPSDSLSTLRQVVKAVGEETPVVILTGSALPWEARLSFIEAGAAGFSEKIGDLHDVVQTTTLAVRERERFVATLQTRIAEAERRGQGEVIQRLDGLTKQLDKLVKAIDNDRRLRKQAPHYVLARLLTWAGRKAIGLAHSGVEAWASLSWRARAALFTLLTGGAGTGIFWEDAGGFWEVVRVWAESLLQSSTVPPQ